MEHQKLNILEWGDISKELGKERKFIQISWRGERMLIFSSHFPIFHAGILRWFCLQQSLRYRVVGTDCLQVEHPDFEMMGGGWFRLEQERLHLFGNSTAYGYFDDPDQLPQLIAASGSWLSDRTCSLGGRRER